MLLPILGIALALTAPPSALAGSESGEVLEAPAPYVFWLPSHIAAIEADADGPVVAWRILRDPTTVRAPILRGATDRRVAQLQRHLAELGVFRGEIDGEYGRQTAAAVVAVHKLADIDRTDTWAVEDWDLELDHSAILERHPEEANRIEVDIHRQVMFIIRNEAIAAIIPVSSGNGETYWSKNGGPEGGYVRARTPKGSFRIFKHVDGWRKNYLGSLYKPWYFTPYYAVHGSSSVPPWPASHGCVRVPNWEANHLDSLMQIGLPIHIWDEPYEPESSDQPAAEPVPTEPPDDLV